MAIDMEEGGHRPEPGLGMALMTVLTMIVCTAVLAFLIYVLMTAVAATSSDKASALEPMRSPALAVAYDRAPILTAITPQNSSG